MSDQQLTILDLPVDILALILRPLLVSATPISLCPCSSPPSPLASPTRLLPVLLIHPSLHAIACPLFYAANSFTLDLSGAHHAHARRIVRQPTPSLGETDADLSLPPLLLRSPSALRRIHRLVLTLDRLRGWLADTLVPLLQHMVVGGCLARLEVRVRGAAAHAHGDKLAHPPFGTVLALLADPDLREARLRVQREHGGAWCGFHADGCGRATGGGEAGDGLVEVDWRRMLREVDPGGRELGVAWAWDDDAAIRGRR